MFRYFIKLRRIKGSFLLLFRKSSTAPIPPVQARLSNNNGEVLINNNSDFIGNN